MIAVKKYLRRLKCDVPPQPMSDLSTESSRRGHAEIGLRSDSSKCFSQSVASNQDSEIHQQSKHCSISGCQDDISSRQQTISFLGQTRTQAKLLRQYGDLQTRLSLDKTNSKQENQRNNSSKHVRHGQELTLKQKRNFQDYSKLCDMSQRQDGNSVGFEPKKKTHQKLPRGTKRSPNINNSNLGNPTNAGARGTSYENIPFPGGSTLPPSAGPQGVAGHLLLGPDQIDMLLALAVSNCSGTDMIGCCKLALQSSQVHNILRNYLVAVKYRLFDVMDKLILNIRRNFLPIAQTREFLSLPLEFVLVFMEDSFLNVDDELDMFVIALSWIDYNKQERIPQAGQILKCVRYVHIDPVDISLYVEPNLHLFTGLHGSQALVNLYKHHVSRQSGQTTTSFNEEVPPKRRMPSMPDQTHIVSDKYNPGTQNTQDKFQAPRTEGTNKSQVPKAQGTQDKFQTQGIEKTYKSPSASGAQSPSNKLAQSGTGSNTDIEALSDESKSSLPTVSRKSSSTKQSPASRKSPAPSGPALSRKSSATRQSPAPAKSPTISVSKNQSKEKVKFQSDNLLEKRDFYSPENLSSTDQSNNASFQCGNSSFNCDNVGLQCGNSNVQCDNAGLKCGNSSFNCDNAGLKCGNSKFQCDNADLKCGNSNVQCDNVGLKCGNSKVQCDNVGLKCGNSNVQCDNAGLKCGNSKFQCDNADLKCDNSKFQCDNADLKCGNSNVQCDNASLKCGNSSFKYNKDQTGAKKYGDIATSSHFSSNNMAADTQYLRARSTSHTIPSPNKHNKHVSFSSATHYQYDCQKISLSGRESKSRRDQRGISPMSISQVHVSRCSKPRQTSPVYAHPRFLVSYNNQKIAALCKESPQRLFTINRVSSGPVVSILYPRNGTVCST